MAASDDVPGRLAAALQASKIANTESRVEVAFVEAGIGFPEEVVALYRSIAIDLRETFGVANVMRLR